MNFSGSLLLDVNGSNDDISLADDTDQANDVLAPPVPEFVNVPVHFPVQKAVVAAQEPVHVVPVGRVVAAPDPNDPTQAIMPPPRQDMEMVSSLSDAEEASAASSLTMGSVISKLTAS